jgi:fumarylacetoacetase
MTPDTQSWVTSANDPHCGFSLNTLPYCAFSSATAEIHLGVGIGSKVLDLHVLAASGHLDFLTASLGEAMVHACLQPRLNPLMALGPATSAALRQTLTDLLHHAAPLDLQQSLAKHLHATADLNFVLPVSVPNYTDFYASIHHAANVGRLFRPDQPLLPNYLYVPIAYHGRASSLVLSGASIRRPHGQIKSPDDPTPAFKPTAQLDYEIEIAAYIAEGNPLGAPIPVTGAPRHIFGFSLLNDWSARDMQSWEYQPLGPFLGKNFATTLSPWVIPNQALEPFRVPRPPRSEANPAPLPYLDDSNLDHPSAPSAIDMTVEVHLTTPQSRASSLPPFLLSRGNLRDLYWSFPQMIAHHTSNGCNLLPGDLLGSGTISGPTPGAEGCLLEITRRGQQPRRLPNGESRTFLEDGDEIILTGYCERPGIPRISLGECRGTIAAALPSNYHSKETPWQPPSTPPSPPPPTTSSRSKAPTTSSSS